MLLAIKRFFARQAPPVEPAASEVTRVAPDGDERGSALDAEAERLWRAARVEPSPFRRDALYLQAAHAMIDSAAPISCACARGTSAIARPPKTSRSGPASRSGRCCRASRGGARCARFCSGSR